jgi:multidrug efflux system outer membrane protein
MTRRAHGPAGRAHPLALAAATLAVAGCASLAPPLPQGEPGIAAAWTEPAAAPAAAPSVPSAAKLGWRDFFADPALNELVARALADNRDLRATVLDVERARALYRVQRADQFPTVGASALWLGSGGARIAGARDEYTVGLGVTDFELDLFGRVRDLGRAALERYFAQEEAARAARLVLVAEVANAYFTLAADRGLEKIALATLATQEAVYRLSEQRHALGAVSALDVAQARTTVETARSDAARFGGQVARDINALQVLVGGAVDPGLLPGDFDASVRPVPRLPAGLPSEVLLQRPDVLAAERRLAAANANIGAARAAFFPSIRLTGTFGTSSDALSALFGSGTRFWTLLPVISVPIFEGGRLQGNLDAARAEQDIALAQYERAVQAGFREVADALALSGTLAQQLAAQQALVDAAERANALSRARYDAGRDSFLVVLDAERTFYAAQQSLLLTRLAEQNNRVALYKALGGGLEEGAR